LNSRKKLKARFQFPAPDITAIVRSQTVTAGIGSKRGLPHKPSLLNFFIRNHFSSAFVPSPNQKISDLFKVSRSTPFLALSFSSLG
jgi:hypothetical protein